MSHALRKEIVRCVATPDDQPMRFKEFRLRDWQISLAWLYKSGLTFPLLKKIEHDDAVPAAIKNRLHNDLASNQLRMADMFQEFRGINEAFQSAGIGFAVQKGFSLIPEYCAEPAMRHQTDFDYLIAPHCLEQACNILRACGYTSETRTDTEHVLQTPLKTPPPEHNFFILQPSRSVELHLQLWQGSTCDVHIPAPQDALDHLAMRTLQGHTFPALSPEDVFVGQTIHALRHIFYFWMRLSWLWEISHFVRQQQGNAEFWQRVGARVQWDRRVAEVIGVVLCLAEEVFKVSIPPSLASWTTEALPDAPKLWVKRYGWEFILSPAPGSKLSLLLEEYFAPRTPEWQRSRRERLLPLHRPKLLTAEPPVLQPAKKKASPLVRCAGILRRMDFHLGSFVRYGVALPGWRWSLRSAGRKIRSEQVLAANSADVVAGTIGGQSK